MLVSIISLHSMECLLFIDTPEEFGTGVVSSMHLEWCNSRRSLLLKQSACACLLCPGCWCTPGHNDYLQTNDNHRQGDLNHYFITFFVQKSRTILNSVMIMIKTEVVCWLCPHEMITSINLFVTETHCILQEK